MHLVLIAHSFCCFWNIAVLTECAGDSWALPSSDFVEPVLMHCWYVTWEPCSSFVWVVSLWWLIIPCQAQTTSSDCWYSPWVSGFFLFPACGDVAFFSLDAPLVSSNARWTLLCAPRCCFLGLSDVFATTFLLLLLRMAVCEWCGHLCSELRRPAHWRLCTITTRMACTNHVPAICCE